MLPEYIVRIGWLITFLIIQKWVSVWHSCPKSTHHIFCCWQKFCLWVLSPWTGVFQESFTSWSKALLKPSCLIPSLEESLSCPMAFTAPQKAATLPRTYKRTSPDLASESSLNVSDPMPTYKNWSLCLSRLRWKTTNDSAALRSQKI